MLLVSMTMSGFDRKTLRNGIEIKIPDGVRRQVPKLLQAAIAGQAGGVANQAGGGGVIGMLVLIGMRGQHDPGLKAADLAGDGKRVFGAVAEVAIAAPIEKMVQEAEFGSHDARGRVGFLDALLGRAVAAGLAFRKHRDPDLVAFLDLLDQ